MTARRRKPREIARLLYIGRAFFLEIEHLGRDRVGPTTRVERLGPYTSQQDAVEACERNYPGIEVMR